MGLRPFFGRFSLKRNCRTSTKTPVSCAVWAYFLWSALLREKRAELLNFAKIRWNMPVFGAVFVQVSLKRKRLNSIKTPVSSAVWAYFLWSALLREKSHVWRSFLKNTSNRPLSEESGAIRIADFGMLQRELHGQFCDLFGGLRFTNISGSPQSFGVARVGHERDKRPAGAFSLS